MVASGVDQQARWWWLPEEGAYAWWDGATFGTRALWDGSAWVYSAGPPGVGSGY